MTIDDAAAQLSELVERIYTKGDSAVLVKAGRPMARIVPVLGPCEFADNLATFLRRWRNDIPEPDEGFAEAILDSRRTIRRREIHGSDSRLLRPGRLPAGIHTED